MPVGLIDRPGLGGQNLFFTAAARFTDLDSGRDDDGVRASAFAQFQCTDDGHIAHVIGVLQYRCERRIHDTGQLPVVISGDRDVASDGETAFEAFLIGSVCHIVICTDHCFHVRKPIQQLIDLLLDIRRKISVEYPVFSKRNVIVPHDIQNRFFTFLGIGISLWTGQIGNIPVAMIPD